MRFLIVDDDERIRRMIKTVVADISETVYEGSDGAQAVLAYQQYQPDWVFMDVEMGDSDGLSATREICNAYPEARVVIVTKHSGEAMREAASDAGACAYVLKENLLDLRELLTVKTQTLNLNKT